MPGLAAPAPFPVPAIQTPTPALLAERGFRLRATRDDDLPWLRDLYASTRAEELAPLPWPDEAKRAFLEQQFALQHAHYLTHFADADFWAVEGADGPVGRLYLRRTAPDHLLVDISLFPLWRTRGIGGALIAAVQSEAAALGRGVALHVAHGNAGAQRLYERLGFAVRPDADLPTHAAMHWRPERPSA